MAVGWLRWLMIAVTRWIQSEPDAIQSGMRGSSVEGEVVKRRRNVTAAWSETRREGVVVWVR